MGLFSLLWVPLFYLFRRSIAEEGSSGGVLALLCGCVHAVILHIPGSMIHPGGFGFSRWLFAFVDMVSLPVLVPLLVYSIFTALRFFPDGLGSANFTLLWLVPVAVLRAIVLGSGADLSTGDPLLLVATPLLWTALAAGIPFLTECLTLIFRFPAAVCAGISGLALPAAAASAWWALFSQHTILGMALLLASLIPMLVSITRDFIRSKN